MNRFLMLCLMLALSVAGCSITQDESSRDRLIGSWFHDVSVMGQRTRSVLTLYADGTFSEERNTHNPVVRVRQQIQGTWRATYGRIDLEYPKGFDGEGNLETDSRVITHLTGSDFVSEDTKFKIVVARKRVLAQ